MMRASYAINILIIFLQGSAILADEWGPCTKSCGRGRQKKKDVSCLIPGFCEEWRACNVHQCWDKWSACSKTCGGGTRHLVKDCTSKNLLKCPKTYEDCNTQKCKSLSSCPNSRYLYRYQDKSKCCLKTSETCGRISEKVHARVVGGHRAKLGQWPWGALIKYKNAIHCGATLLHKQWLLTAAHCLYTYELQHLTVTMGTVTISSPAKSVKIIGVEKYIIHPDYKDPLNDIGLIKLKSPVKENDFMKPACLPGGEIIKEDTACYAIGWGIANQAGLLSSTPSDILMQVRLRILPLDVCTVGYSNTGYSNSITRNHICAGIIAGGKDTCRGDSGGPLLCQRCSSCTWFVAGVTSFGSQDCGTAKLPAVYAHVTKYEKWIKSQVTGLPHKSFRSCYY